MPNGTKEQIGLLVKLQQIEVESNRIEATLSTVDSRIAAFEDHLKDFEKSIDEEKLLLKEYNQKYRAYESDIQINLSRIAKSQQKLRAVKTNKEYQSGLKEIEDLQAISSQIEDEMLEYLDRIDQVEIKLEEKKDQYSKLVEQTQQQKTAIKQETEQGRERLAQLKKDWNHITGKIDSDLLEKFNRTKAKQADRIAIVPVNNAVCRGCNMNIPPQMYNELHRFDSLKTCPHCERIIYLEDHNGRSE